MTSRVLCVTALVLAFAAPSVHADDGLLSEAELQKLYLDVVELTVDVFEPIWSVDPDVPNAGRYDFRKYDTWGRPWYDNVITVPGTGQVIYCYSVLLNETDKEVFGKRKLTRAEMLDRCIKSLRWCCLTSAYVENPYPFHPVVDAHNFYDGKQWRRKLGYRADEVGWLSVAAARLWDKLDDETKGLIEQVMIGGAQPERLVRSWRAGGQGGNHDVVKQDLSSTIGAAYLFPKRDDHAKYQDIIRGNGVDLVATVHDQACSVKADGKPIQQWSAEGVELYRKQNNVPGWRQIWNLYPDYSSDHHGWCQVWYGCDLIFEGRMYIEMLSHVYKKPVPQVYTYPGNGFDGVLEWVKDICLPEGEPASIHGMEYDAYYGSGLLAYCYGALIKKDPVAATLEQLAAQLLTEHSHAVRLYDYHRNCYAKAATCYLMHKIHGPGAKPLSYEEAWQKRNGNTHYAWQQAVVHRSPNTWASWTWGTMSARGPGRMAGFVVPARGGQGTEEPFAYLLGNSLIGSKTVTWKGAKPPGFSADPVYRNQLSDDGLVTIGTVPEPGLDRHYAFFAFDRGPVVLFTAFRAHHDCSMTFQGVPIFFFVRPKLTSSRTYYDAAGNQPLETAAERTSSWWCVDDRLGMAVLSKSHKQRIKRVVGKNWARTEAYKDKADAIYTGTIDAADVKAGQFGVDMISAYYTETPHDQVKAAAERLKQGKLDLPDGWKGAVVPDARHPGRAFLCIANFDGAVDEHTSGFSFDHGAPVLSQELMIDDTTAIGPLKVARHEAIRDELDLFIKVVDKGRPVFARRETRSRYRIRPTSTEPTHLMVCYAGAQIDTMVVTGIGPDGKPRDRAVAGSSLVGCKPVGVTLNGPTVIELRGGPFADTTGPAVEITDIIHRPDGVLDVRVSASDQSGLESVVLMCDGKQLARPSGGELRWSHRVKEGAHTFAAIATDASPAKNQRTSFKRTVVVHRHHERP